LSTANGVANNVVVVVSNVVAVAVVVCDAIDSNEKRFSNNIGLGQ
jgi:hypothetical protein